MKTFKITSENKPQKLYQIERSDKVTPMRYLVFADGYEKAQEVCKALAEDTQAAIAKYDIDACMK